MKSLNSPSLLCGLALLVLTGCGSFGPRSVPGDRFDYNQAIATSRDEQMLLNIVRIRYLQIPDFLAVSSVITSYSYSGGVGVAGQRGFGRASDVLSGAANVAYAEKPTITYAPLAGQEFSRRMLRPIPIEVLFSLGQAGWPTDILMNICLQRMNDVENMGFGQVPAPGQVNIAEQFRREQVKLERFQRMLKLITYLDSQEVIEVLKGVEQDEEGVYMRFAETIPEDLRKYRDELKKDLGLDPERNLFRITDSTTSRQPDEITIRTRSLLAIMSFLSRGIQIPAEDAQAGTVILMPPDVEKAVLPRIPLRIRSSSSQPAAAFIAIKYRGSWFYIDDSDIKSKRTFATTLVLFQLQAPSGGTAAPLLTLPTG